MKRARGYLGVGVYRPKVEANIGSLMRSAFLHAAAFVFTVEKRYVEQASDTPRTRRSIPLFHFADMADLMAHMPAGATLVGVELHERSRSLPEYGHPERAVYLFGAEDRGLPQEVIDQCESLIQIPTSRPESMNVASAGAVVLYDRHVKALR